MQKRISIIGVPMDYGQSRRGVDMGPTAIRYAGVVNKLQTLGYTVNDLGDIHIPIDSTTDQQTNLKNLRSVISANDLLYQQVQKVVEDGEFPLVLGGDHSIAIGSIAGIQTKYENLGVIWYDAHGDLNTPETSPSGNIHGMSLAVNLGLGHASLTSLGGDKPKIKPENVVIIGARDLDNGEKLLIKKLGLKVFTMHEIDKLGMSKVIEETLEYLKHTDGVHLSLDLDGIDPIYCPGVGTPVLGGITYRESHLALELLSEAGVITSAEFVEVNPILDEKNKTANIAVALIGSLFEEKTLEPLPVAETVG